MLQTDFLMRAIEQFLQALIRIVKLKLTGKREEALAEIRVSVEHMTGMKPEVLVTMPLDYMLELIKDQDQVSIQRGVLLARLLKEQGEVLLLLDSPAAPSASEAAAAARPFLVKAMLLFDALLERATDEELVHFGDHQDSMTWLAEQLDA